jgi:hypothetical protein
MAKISGSAGSAYVASTVIDVCDVAWTNGTHGTASLETSIKKCGIGSAKIVGSSVADGDYIGYHAIVAGATNYTGFTHALCWARSSATTADSDLKLVIDKDAGLPSSPESELTFPVLTANTWKYCHLTNVAGKELTNSTAGVTVALQYAANHADTTIYLDNIRACKTVLGIKSWKLDYKTSALDTSDFACAGVKTFVIGCSEWSGSFDGYKDGAPLSMGAIYGVELAESATSTQMYLGDIIITGVNPSVGFDGIVTVSYTFQGTDILTVSTT